MGRHAINVDRDPFAGVAPMVDPRPVAQDLRVRARRGLRQLRPGSDTSLICIRSGAPQYRKPSPTGVWRTSERKSFRSLWVLRALRRSAAIDHSHDTIVVLTSGGAINACTGTRVSPPTVGSVSSYFTSMVCP